jgi:hypothetical protein
MKTLVAVSWNWLLQGDPVAARRRVHLATFGFRGAAMRSKEVVRDRTMTRGSPDPIAS